MQRKKMRDQNVFGTKKCGEKRQINLLINRWLSHTKRGGSQKKKRKNHLSYTFLSKSPTQKNLGPLKT
jgi:hypothetical protein